MHLFVLLTLLACFSSWPTTPAITTTTSTSSTTTTTATTSTNSKFLSTIQAQDDSSQLETQEHQPHYEPLTSLSSDSQNHQNQNYEDSSTNLQQQSSNSKQRSGKRTLYACEEKELQIECQYDESIHLIRANYGRYSIQICNEHGQLDWKVNCQSPSSVQIISNSCQAKQSCQLLASNKIFGDSCPGTQKYLEVHYECVPAGSAALFRGQTMNNKTSTPTDQSGRHQPPTAQGKQNHRNNNINSNVMILDVPTAATTTTINSILSNQQTISENIRPPAILMSPPYTPSTRLSIANNINNNNNPVASSPPTPFDNNLPLPPWIPRGRFNIPAPMNTNQQPRISDNNSNSNDLLINQQQQQQQANNSSSGGSRLGQVHCPEIVWRQVNWPATEPGQLVQMACPAHAQPSQPNEPNPLTLACLANGQWAQQHSGASCQSIWLKLSSQRLENGDSPLSLMAELVGKTRPVVQQQQSLTTTTLMPLLVNPLGMSAAATTSSSPGFINSLFGEDIVQLSKIVRRLATGEMGELLNRIADDKQRVAFAREMVQSLVELLNNLAHEQHLDAWMDLAQFNGQRARISAQLMQSMEAATVLLAGATQQQQTTNNNHQSHTHTESHRHEHESEFTKLTENVYVTIKPFSLPSWPLANNNNNNNNNNDANNGQQATNNSRSIQVSFPSESSTLGTRWTEQRFTLHLQAAPNSNANSLYNQPTLSEQQQQTSQADVKHLSDDLGAAQALKIVFVMIKGFGSQLEPQTAQPARDPLGSLAQATNNNGDNNNNNNANRMLIVNSNLVSLSIVADSRYKYTPIKVDLSEPIELVFKHLIVPLSSPSGGEPSTPSASWNPFKSSFAYNNGNSNGNSNSNSNNNARHKQASPRCVYWDTNISDWLTDGCMLVGTNRTHSICACNHLSTFGLLSEFDETLQQSYYFNNNNNQMAAVLATSPNQNHNGNNGGQNQQQPKVQLDSVENELILPNNRMLYLAKMLDGHLFASGQQPQQQSLDQQTTTASSNLRLVIYISCLLSAPLLAIYLIAIVYNQAHARRLLGAIPVHQPPPLLVTSNTNGVVVRGPTFHSTNHQSGAPPAGSDGSPTYSSSIDYSAALNAVATVMSIANTKSSKQSFNNNNNNDNETAFDLMNLNDKEKAARLNGTNNNKTFDKIKSSIQQQWSNQFHIPIHVIVQLLTLQLLIVLLVESQNYLQRNRNSSAYLLSSFTNDALNSNFSSMLNPIGTVTWLVVLTLYYLIASLFFWLIGQLLKLNINLINLGKVIMSSTNGNNNNNDPDCDRKLFACISPSTGTGSSNTTTGGAGAGPPCNDNKYNSAGTTGTGSIYNGATTTTTVATATGSASATTGRPNQQPQQQHQGNFYGAPASIQQHCYNVAQTTTVAAPNNVQFNSSISPSSSTFSSQSIVDLAAYNQHHLHFNRRSNDDKKKGTSRSSSSKSFICSINSILSTITNPLRLVDLIVVQGMPIATIVIVCLFASNKSQLFNSLTYTTTLGSQLAYWPLLVDMSLTLISLLIYYGPAICLILIGLALFMLNRLQRQPTKNNNNNNHSNNPFQMNDGGALMMHRNLALPSLPRQSVNGPNAVSSLHQQLQKNNSTGQNGMINPYGTNLTQQQEFGQKQQSNIESSYWQSNGASCASIAEDLKKAKFLCFMLTALVILHSICWITFFAHIQQALNDNNNNRDNNWLIYTFACSNLLLTLLLLWSQRRSLRRAIQLVGLNRLLNRFLCLTAPRGYNSNDGRSNSPKIRGGGAASGHQQRFYSGATSLNDCLNVDNSNVATICGANGKVAGLVNSKVSPSNQSLFLISQQQQQQQQQLRSSAAMYGTNYHYGAYGSGNIQQQQHLYQQLANQQHIYDSTTAINNLVNNSEQPRATGGFMQMIQTRQQQFDNNNMNRSMSSLHPMHLQQHYDDSIINHHQNHHPHQQQQRHHPMTLRPTMTMNNQANANNTTCGAGLMVLDAQAALKQQQQYQLNFQQQQQQQQAPSVSVSASSAGEADGPLVALSSNSSGSPAPATFGPTNHNNYHQQQNSTPIIAMANHHHHHHQFKQPTAVATEHQLFSQQQQHNNDNNENQDSVANCINGENLSRRNCSLTSGMDANQFSYHSNQLNHQNNNNNNYTDALKQQQQQHNSGSCDLHHFRRSNSKQRAGGGGGANNQLRAHQLAAVSNMIDRGMNENNNNFDKNITTLTTASSNNIYDVANYVLNN